MLTELMWTFMYGPTIFETITLQVIVVICLICILFDDFVVEENEICAY